MTLEFTVKLQSDGSWDVFIDDDPAHLGLSDDGLLDFAERFRSDNLPGPTYAVWTAEQSDHTQQWVWRWETDYSCEDDPDGTNARASAHQYARYLRKTYPCAYVAVLPAGKQPLPIHNPGNPALAGEGEINDFSSSWLGQ